MSDHNIQFKRNGKKVEIHVPTDLPHTTEGNATKYVFSYEMGSVQAAELLFRYLNKRHTDTIAAIREAEFDSGWKHAKAKKHGRKRFGWFMFGMKKKATH